MTFVNIFADGNKLLIELIRKCLIRNLIFHLLCILKVTLLSFASIWCLSLSAQHEKYSLENADSLFKQYKLAESLHTYAMIANNPEYVLLVRVKAYEKLAEQEWKFYQNYSAAIKYLQLASGLKTEPYGIDLLKSDINDQARQFRQAIIGAEESLRFAKNDNEGLKAGIALAKALYDQNEQHASDGLLNRRELLRAALILHHILQIQPGNPDASELLIGVGLLLMDGNSVLDGWKSYYLATNEQNINSVLQPGYFKLKTVMVKWNGNSLQVDQMKTLAIALAETKFFKYADLILRKIQKEKIAVFNHSLALQDIAAYYSYILAVQNVNDRIYPQVARGRTKYEDAYDSLMNIPAKQLWNKLSFTDKHQKFDPDSFYNIMNKKYDMEGYSGFTVNYYGMLMGHIIHKEPRQVSQYGYRTTLTYLSVDQLISQDFTSWYGTTNVGGWGDSVTIIQVRKAYMTEPFELLNWMLDSGIRKNIQADIEKKKQLDFAICKNDPYAEPKFLANYIKLKAAASIYKHLIDSGLSGTALNVSFIDRVIRLTIASTVFAHEGRHAIDQLYFPKEFKTWSDDERELRAKFSEVVYSLDPKLAFTGSILGSDLADNTNHGKANRRFLKIIADWMDAHQAEIKDVDKNIPLLMQFDLLSDAQLIAICKSADPLANKN